MTSNMSYGKDSMRLAWLAALLGEKKKTLAALLRSLTVFTPRGSMPSSHFRKFITLLSQVADEKDKETALISQIEAIEQKHRFGRGRCLLRSACVTHEPRPLSSHNFENAEAERPGMDLPWLLFLWYLFFRHPKPQK